MNISELAKKHLDKFKNCKENTILVTDGDIVITSGYKGELDKLSNGDNYIIYNNDTAIVCEIENIISDEYNNRIYFAKQLA